MIDTITILIGIMLGATVVVALEYYQLLRKAQKEYERAREVVEDVVLSFDRQLKRENERLELIAYKIEGIASRNDGALNKANQIEKQVNTLEAKIATAPEDREKVLARLDVTDSKLRDITASQETVISRITSLEEQAKHIPAIPEASIEAVIPIKRDRALAPLTETELLALEFLASEGPKTAPEIKERIKLSREHTARLMKKLYESGYLERDTNKIPFKYTVKKEMENLLKKIEPQQT